MSCRYCGNPIGLFTEVRLGGFCEPRHAALFQACERIAARGLEGFRPAAVEACGRDAEASASATAVWSPRATIPAASLWIDSCRATLRADWRYAKPRCRNIAVRPLPPEDTAPSPNAPVAPGAVPPCPPRRLGTIPPAVWTPWRSWGAGQAVGSNWIGRGAPAVLDPVEFSVPAAAMCARAADPPGLSQPMAGAIRRALEQRDRSAQPCPPSAMTVEPSPGARPPRFRPQLRQRDPVPLRPLCGFELFPQFPCQRPPEFPAMEASAFPSRLSRDGLRTARMGNNLVVMPYPGSPAPGRLRGVRAADCQPAATALRAFRLPPLAAIASPSFAMDPCELPPAGEGGGA
jgi:hypothetical protein